MSNDIQDKESLKEYCLLNYEKLLNERFIFYISERDAGKKNAKKGIRYWIRKYTPSWIKKDPIQEVLENDRRTDN